MIAALFLAVSLVHVGTRTPDLQIMAITIGNTQAAERTSRRWAATFGPNCLDAEVYVRADYGWRMTDFVRPRTTAQLKLWKLNPEYLRVAHEHVTPPFDDEAIDYIIAYHSGATKVYLVPGASDPKVMNLYSKLKKQQEQK